MLRSPFALLVALGLAASLGAAAIGGFVAGRDSRGRDGDGVVQVRDGAAVITAMRDVAKLETTVFHIEKVVEASQGQSYLGGFLRAKDALLLVAAGDVIAGVELSELGGRDLAVDRAGASIRVRLPPPMILHAALDERATHVYSRSTDVFAERNEQLEGAARRAAEEQIRNAAVEAGILDRARVSCERTMRGLLQSLGFRHAEIDWSDRG